MKVKAPTKRKKSDVFERRDALRVQEIADFESGITLNTCWRRFHSDNTVHAAYSWVRGLVDQRILQNDQLRGTLKHWWPTSRARKRLKEEHGITISKKATQPIATTKVMEHYAFLQFCSRLDFPLFYRCRPESVPAEFPDVHVAPIKLKNATRSLLFYRDPTRDVFGHFLLDKGNPKLVDKVVLPRVQTLYGFESVRDRCDDGMFEITIGTSNPERKREIDNDFSRPDEEPPPCRCEVVVIPEVQALLANPAIKKGAITK